MRASISHDRESESPEAKARWFQSLDLKDRMDLFCEMTDLALEIRPDLMAQGHAQPAQGRIQVLRAT